MFTLKSLSNKQQLFFYFIGTLKTKINRYEKTTFEVTVTLILKIKFEYLRFKFKVVLYRKRDQKILFKYVEEKSIVRLHS